MAGAWYDGLGAWLRDYPIRVAIAVVFCALVIWYAVHPEGDEPAKGPSEIRCGVLDPSTGDVIENPACFGE